MPSTFSPGFNSLIRTFLQLAPGRGLLLADTMNLKADQPVLIDVIGEVGHRELRRCRIKLDSQSNVVIALTPGQDRKDQPELLSISPISCYTLVGWPDDRGAGRLVPNRSLLPSLAAPANGLQSKPLSSRPGKPPEGRKLFDPEFIVGKKLYVGNLTYNVNEADLEALFTPFGTVQSAQVIVDRDTNRSKGFGFVEMDTNAQARRRSRPQRPRARRAAADRQRSQATRGSGRRRP